MLHEPRDERARFALVLLVGRALALDRTHFGVGDAGDKEQEDQHDHRAQQRGVADRCAQRRADG